MREEKGITLAILVITVIVMGILATILVNATMGGNLLKNANSVQENFYEVLQDTDEKIQNVEDKWEGVT